MGAGVGSPACNEEPVPGLIAFWPFDGLFCGFLLASVGTGVLVLPAREVDPGRETSV